MSATIGMGNIGGVAIAQQSDANDQPVYDNPGGTGDPIGSGYCAAGGGYASYDGQNENNLYTADGELLVDAANCSYALHHTSTALLSVGAAGLIGSAIYYFFFMRPKETISRENRLQAVSAAKGHAKPRL